MFIWQPHSLLKQTCDQLQAANPQGGSRQGSNGCRCVLSPVTLSLLPESLDRKREITDGLPHRGSKVNSDTNSVHGGFASPEAQTKPSGSQQECAQSCLFPLRGPLCSLFPEPACCLNYKASPLRCPVLSVSYRLHTGMCVTSHTGTEELGDLMASLIVSSGHHWPEMTPGGTVMETNV